MKAPTAFDKAPEQLPEGTPFADLTLLQKFVYVTKVLICIATFGYAFPHV